MIDDAESLWETGREVLGVLHARGHQAFLVGGCVRDRLLGRPLRDIDIAASARPEEVAAAFARTIPTGLRHGTVTVVHKGRQFEVTTFRTEEGYSDARRPDKVCFVSDIREDLARRDFTINAMACGWDETWIDPFGGRKDLAERRIRCVGDARLRFGEDALRMVRAIRFAAEFGFRLNLSVWRGIRLQADRLRRVAMERIGSEWDKMMEGADPDRACALLARSGLLASLKEPLPTVLMDERDAGGTGFRRLRDIRPADRRWIAWIAESGAAAEDAAALCRALHFSGKRVSRIAAAVALGSRVADTPPAAQRTVFLNAVLDLGRAAAEDWLETRLDSGILREWLDALRVDSVGQLAVKGDELAVYLQKVPGAWVSPLLRRLLEEAAFGRLPNEKEVLMQAALAIEADR